MTNLIKAELTAHIENLISEGILTVANFSSWHYLAFHRYKHIKGRNACSLWIKRHGIDKWKGSDICLDHEMYRYGETFESYENTEQLANMVASIYGEKVLAEIQEDLLEKLKSEA